ncbi:hypothetical protein COOONC_06130 [Cooperia oncophora]
MAEKELDQAYLTLIRNPYSKNRQGYDRFPVLKTILDDIGNVIELADNVLQDLNSSVTNISNTATPESRDEMSSSFSVQVHLLHSSFLAAFSDIFHRAVNISPKCRTLMSIWDGLGGYACDWISAPAQGLWVACSKVGVGRNNDVQEFYFMLLPLSIHQPSIMHFNPASFFDEYAESTRERSFGRKITHKKLDYVHRKLGQHRGTPKDDTYEEMSHSPRGSTTTAAATTTPSSGAVPEKKDPSTPTANKPTDGSEGSEEAAKRSRSKETTSNVSKETTSNASKETLSNTSKGTISHEEKAPE